MCIVDVLGNKGVVVVMINFDVMVGELFVGFVEQNIGVMVVVGVEGVVGIVLECDVVCQLYMYGVSVLFCLVVKIMLIIVVICIKFDMVDKISVLMIENWVCYVLVFDGKKLIGIVSIGDVVKLCMGEFEVEQQQFQFYIIQG